MAFSKNDLAAIKLVMDGLRVSKVVCTRAIKTKRGDFFVGLSAAWDTTQEDAGGPGADLIDAMDEGEQHAAIIAKGMSLQRARIAGLILGMRVDLQATAHALGGGAIDESEYDLACTSIKRNYGKLLAEALSSKNGAG